MPHRLQATSTHKTVQSEFKQRGGVLVFRTEHNQSIKTAKCSAFQNVIHFVQASTTTDAHLDALDDILTIVNLLGDGRIKAKYPLTKLLQVETLARVLVLQLGCSPADALPLAKNILLLTTHRHETFDHMRQYFGHSPDTRTVANIRTSIATRRTQPSSTRLTHAVVERHLTKQELPAVTERILSLCDDPVGRQRRIKWCVEVAPQKAWDKTLFTRKFLHTFLSTLAKQLDSTTSKKRTAPPLATPWPPEIAELVRQIESEPDQDEKRKGLSTLTRIFFRHQERSHSELGQLLKSLRLNGDCERYIVRYATSFEHFGRPHIEIIYHALTHTFATALAAAQATRACVVAIPNRRETSLPGQDQIQIMVLQNPHASSQSPGLLLKFTYFEATVVDATLCQFVQNEDGTLTYHKDLRTDFVQGEQYESDLREHEFTVWREGLARAVAVEAATAAHTTDAADDVREELMSLEATLAARERTLKQEEEALKASRAQFDASRAQLDGRAQELDRREGSLRKREDALLEREGSLREQESMLLEREGSLREREDALRAETFILGLCSPKARICISDGASPMTLDDCRGGGATPSTPLLHSSSTMSTPERNVRGPSPLPLAHPSQAYFVTMLTTPLPDDSDDSPRKGECHTLMSTSNSPQARVRRALFIGS